MTDVNEVLKQLSDQLPLNTDRLFVKCKASDCEVFYPCELKQENVEAQTEYMLKVKDTYQNIIDEVQKQKQDVKVIE